MVFFIDQRIPWKLNNYTTSSFVTNEGALLHSIPTQILKQRLISIHVLSFCTEDFTAINLPCRYGVCDSCCQTQLQNTPIQFIKRYKWHRTVLNWFVDQAQQQFLTEMGYCRYISTLNFPSRSLAKKNGSGKNTTGQYYCEPDPEIEVYFL